MGDLEFDSENITDYRDILSVCAGLVTVDEQSSIIRLVHYTVQEYLHRTQSHWFRGDGAVIYKNPETYVTRTCLTYMSFQSFEDKLLTSWDDVEEMAQAQELYSYAACNWGYHSVKAVNVLPEILQFLGSKTCARVASQFLWYEERLFHEFQDTQMTGLHIASYFGIVDAIDALLPKPVYLSTPGSATRSKSVTALESKDRMGQTPLVWAARNGNFVAAERLLDAGADLETNSEESLSPLSWCSANGHLEIGKLLLDRGANPDTVSGDQPPVLWAAENGHAAILKELIKRDAALDVVDERMKQTALVYAALKGHMEVAELLLSHGMDPDFSTDGIPPSIWAARVGHIDMIKLLMKHGADIEYRDADWGQTPLVSAAYQGHKSIVQLLLDLGASIESKDALLGQTALSAAADEVHLTVVEALLDRGADMESTTKDGRTPLIRAAKARHREIVRVLFQRGASPMLDHDSLLQPSDTNDVEEVVDLLLKKHQGRHVPPGWFEN